MIDDKSQQVKPRAALRAIEKGLKYDAEHLNSCQVCRILRDQVFVVRSVGGTRYVLVDKAHLLEVAKQLGIDADLLKQMTPLRARKHENYALLYIRGKQEITIKIYLIIS